MENFEAMVLHPNCMPVNLVGLVAMFCLTIGFQGIYYAGQENLGKWGFAGMILSVAGLIMYTAIQYYETLIWPAAGNINPDLVGNASIINNSNPGWLGILLIAGAIIFGNGINLPLRTLGILMYGPATIIIGIRLRKTHFIPETS